MSIEELKEYIEYAWEDAEKPGDDELELEYESKKAIVKANLLDGIKAFKSKVGAGKKIAVKGGVSARDLDIRGKEHRLDQIDREVSECGSDLATTTFCTACVELQFNLTPPPKPQLLHHHTARCRISRGGRRRSVSRSSRITRG